MHFKKFLCSNPFEYLNDICRCKFWMHYYEKMYVIRHDFLRYKSYTFFFGYLFMEKFKVVCNFICKNLSSVFCRPYEMIICVADTASSCYLMLFFVISIYTYGHYFISKLADYEKRKHLEVYGCIPCLKTRGLAFYAPKRRTFFIKMERKKLLPFFCIRNDRVFDSVFEGNYNCNSPCQRSEEEVKDACVDKHRIQGNKDHDD